MRIGFHTLLLTILLCTTATAQVSLTGCLADLQSGEAIPFATVVLRSTADTAQLYATITDLNGCYALQLPVGEYRFDVNCLGYEPLQAVRLLQGEQQQWADSLSMDAQQIDEVRITAAGRSALRKSYTFGPAKQKQSQHGYDLLQQLPMLKEDLASGRLTGQGGKSVLLLVNGSTATDSDVRMLPPKAIKRVDVYDIPPARYQGVADYVVNIITAEFENGIAGGFDLYHGLLTPYGDDQAYLNLVRGHHKLSLDYDLSLRSYDRSTYSAEFDYTLANIKHSLSYKSTGRDASIAHSPRLKYAYVDLDRRIIEISLRPNISSSLIRHEGAGHYEQDGGLYAEEFTTASSDQERTLNPAADLYYWCRLGGANELSLNVAAAHFDTKRDIGEHELRTHDNAIVLADTLALHNAKASVIGELSYGHALSFGRWEAGYRVQQAWFSSLYDNSFGHSTYSGSQLQQYAHTELSGILGRWSYSLSLGVSHLYSNMGDTVFGQTLFAPRVVLGRGAVRLVYRFTPRNPDVAELSNNTRYLSRHIIERGNPALRSSLLHVVSAAIAPVENDYITLELDPQVAFTKNLMVKRFREAGGVYELQGFSTRRLLMAGFSVWSQLCPFGDERLQFDVFLMPMYGELRWDDVRSEWFTLANSLDVELNIKSFTLKYSLSIPAMQLAGGYKFMDSYGEGSNDISLRYSVGGWRFSVGMLRVGMNPTQRTEMAHPEPVRYVHSQTFGNARNMITLGVAYHFGRGKDWEYDRVLENSDTTVPNQ